MWVDWIPGAAGFGLRDEAWLPRVPLGALITYPAAARRPSRLRDAPHAHPVKRHAAALQHAKPQYGADGVAILLKPAKLVNNSALEPSPRINTQKYLCNGMPACDS